MDSLDLDALKTALQVLTDIAHRRKPDSSDLLTLRRYAEPQYAHFSDEETACEIVERVVRKRQQARMSTAGA